MEFCQDIGARFVNWLEGLMSHCCRRELVHISEL